MNKPTAPPVTEARLKEVLLVHQRPDLWDSEEAPCCFDCTEEASLAQEVLTLRTQLEAMTKSFENAKNEVIRNQNRAREAEAQLENVRKAISNEEWSRYQAYMLKQHDRIPTQYERETADDLLASRSPEKPQ